MMPPAPAPPVRTFEGVKKGDVLGWGEVFVDSWYGLSARLSVAIDASRAPATATAATHPLLRRGARAA